MNVVAETERGYYSDFFGLHLKGDFRYNLTLFTACSFVTRSMDGTISVLVRKRSIA